MFEQEENPRDYVPTPPPLLERGYRRFLVERNEADKQGLVDRKKQTDELLIQTNEAYTGIYPIAIGREMSRRRPNRRSKHVPASNKLAAATMFGPPSQQPKSPVPHSPVNSDGWSLSPFPSSRPPSPLLSTTVSLPSRPVPSLLSPFARAFTPQSNRLQMTTMGLCTADFCICPPEYQFRPMPSVPRCAASVNILCHLTKTMNQVVRHSTRQ